MEEENQKNLSRPLAFIEQMLYPILEQKFYPRKDHKGERQKRPVYRTVRVVCSA